MPATVRVEQQGAWEFRVTVSEGGSQTSHLVAVDQPYYEKLTGGRVSAADLVRRSFEFLLEREPKESILRAFALPVIGRYFPEYERDIRARLGD